MVGGGVGEDEPPEPFKSKGRRMILDAGVETTILPGTLLHP
jgi:hypothetical protein